jgi:acetylornithine deacetylase/succinyl-diaminopimelate desuccinylase-like protein
VLPASASAKISCRLVPAQDPDRVADLLESRLQGLCPPGCSIRMKRLHGARPVLLPVDTAAVRAARMAVTQGFGRDPVFTREGGSIPIVEVFVRVLEAPVVLLGFGRPDDRAHGPDEKLGLEDLWRGARTSAWLWEILGQKGKGA